MGKMKNLGKNSAHIAKAASLLIIAAGIIVLTGWLLNIPSFKSILPGIISIKFNTAVCFILSGIVLYLMEARSSSRFQKNIAFVCSWIVLIIAILNLSEYIFRFKLGIDELLWKEGPGTIATIFPGRMSLSTAINFTLLGFLLPLLGKRKYHWPIQALLIAIIASSMLVILTYLFGFSFLNSFPQVNNTALPTAILFIVLCLGIFKSLPLCYIHFSFQKKIVGFFALIFLILGIIFFTFNKNTEQIGEEKNLSRHAHRVMVLADEVNTEAYSMQSGLSSYILTGEGNFPHSLINSADTINSIMAHLREISQGKEGRQMQLDTLEKHLGFYITFQKELVNTRQKEGYEIAQNIFQKGSGKILLNGIDSIVSVIEQNEVLAMKVRENQIEQSIHNSSKIFNLFLVIAFILLLIGFINIYKNNWKRNKAEAALKKSLKEISDYKYALDESSIVVITDQNGIITQVNDNFCKITKYTRDELLGQDHSIINSGFHTKEFIRDLWITINNGEVWKGEMKNKAKDGTYFWMYNTIVPFMNERGNPYQYVAIRSDITQRKKLEDEIIQFNQELEQKVNERTEELSNREKQLASIFDTVADSIFVLEVKNETDFLFTSVNPAFLLTSGLEYDQVVGKRMNDILPETSLNHVMEKYKEAIETKKIVSWEETSDYPSGRLTGAVSIAPIFDESGNCIKIIGSVHDLTERKKAEEKLTKYAEELKGSNKELENFAYAASHDLQEPLRMVSSFLNLLGKKLNSHLDDTSRQYIDFAIDGAERMKSLIMALLEYSRISANKEKFTTVDLNEVVRYVTNILGENIKKNSTLVTYKLLPVITANKTLITHLFLNLVNNALKYHNGEQSEIEIGTIEESTRYIFYVKDNGIGIDPKFFEKIFVIFQRLHTKKEYPGTGIGLAICKKIVEIHKGKIWVESDPGYGSTFYFSIPIVSHQYPSITLELEQASVLDN